MQPTNNTHLLHLSFVCDHPYQIFQVLHDVSRAFGFEVTQTDERKGVHASVQVDISSVRRFIESLSVALEYVQDNAIVWQTKINIIPKVISINVDSTFPY